MFPGEKKRSCIYVKRVMHFGEIFNEVEKIVGVVYLENGAITKEQLATDFSAIYKTNWPWQIRQLDDYTFLVKFPPHINAEDVARYPSFRLLKKKECKCMWSLGKEILITLRI